MPYSDILSIIKIYHYITLVPIEIYQVQGSNGSFETEMLRNGGVKFTFKREIPSINLKHFVNKLVCLIHNFSTMYRAMLTLVIILALSGSVKHVSAGIFPSSFYFRAVSEPETLQENSVDAKVDESDSYGTISEEDFTALRIEYIKNQILKKLRLKEKPQITLADLPKPIKEYENLLPDQDMNLMSRYDDDFYGKTTQAIVLPYEGKIFNFPHKTSAPLSVTTYF